jgi:CHASE2 domain-containing sensor protein
MAKLVVLEIGTGTLATGFEVTLRVSTEGQLDELSLGQLPPAPQLATLHQAWQMGYRSRMFAPGRGIKALDVQVTRQRSNLKQLSGELEQGVNDWLDQGDRCFQKIRDQLLTTASQAASQNTSVRLIIQTDDTTLWQLPWDRWNLVQTHANLGIAFSRKEVRSIPTAPFSATSRLRVLLLLGDSTHIDIDQDLATLRRQLPEAEIYQPLHLNREHLSDQLWTRAWDILFFAGHSSSDGGEGKIYLDSTTYLTIPDLKHALKHAIAQGLKLAIFNSCDGLSLAHDLADLHLPAAIVMRQSIPDAAAHKFLAYFLTAFVQQRQPLHLALRQTCERLHGLEAELPCVSWLPVACLNPLMRPLALPDPINPIPVRPVANLRIPGRLIVAVSLITTLLILGLRATGKLAPLELAMYDALMRQRPMTEASDDRLLLVEITHSDHDLHGHPIPNLILANLIDKLEAHRPHVIGLDLYRDQPNQLELAFLKQFRQNPNLIAVCTMGDHQTPAIRAPQGVAPKQLGFSDIEGDGDGQVRRQLLSISPHLAGQSQCPTPYSFSLSLSSHYLFATQVPVQVTANDEWQLGHATLKRVKTLSKGYPLLDGDSNQVLLNYRATESLAKTVTLTDVLENRVDPRWIQGKIILIGSTDPRVPDNHQTPYGMRRGLWIHAQMVSQLVSAAKDGRSQISVWSIWQDGLWLLGWALLGGWLIQRFRLLFAVGFGMGILIVHYQLSLWLLVWGWWVPVVPAIMAFILTSGILKLYLYYPPQRRRLSECNSSSP